jgi:metal-sulfur cluster biosynthetic enzyme
MSDLDARIEERLSRVHDPCSVAAGRPTSLIDMGMVLGWALRADGVLDLRLCVTFAGCTMAPHFVQAAIEQLATLPGVKRVDVRVDTDFEWTPERMRSPSRPMQGEPQAWRNRAT